MLRRGVAMRNRCAKNSRQRSHQCCFKEDVVICVAAHGGKTGEDGIDDKKISPLRCREQINADGLLILTDAAMRI